MKCYIFIDVSRGLHHNELKYQNVMIKKILLYIADS